MVYRLVTANTIDQRIVERAATKRRLEKMVIHKGQCSCIVMGKVKRLGIQYKLSMGFAIRKRKNDHVYLHVY